MLGTAMFAFALLGSAPSAPAPPRHIMSINLCTDELLMDLVPPERIASVYFLSQSPVFSFMAPEADRLPINHGLAEEVLAERPELVLAGKYTAPATQALLARVGAKMVSLPPANSFQDIRANVRLVAKAVGEERRGEQLIRQMDATLREVASRRPKHPLRVAAWDGTGSVPGRGSLFNAILEAAGGTNIAASTTDIRYGNYDTEQLLYARPDVLAYGARDIRTPGLRSDNAQHPLLMSLYAKRRITYPEPLYSCGVPQSADAARDLQLQLVHIGAMGATGAPAPP